MNTNTCIEIIIGEKTDHLCMCIGLNLEWVWENYCKWEKEVNTISTLKEMISEELCMVGFKNILVYLVLR